MPKLFLSS